LKHSIFDEIVTKHLFTTRVTFTSQSPLQESAAQRIYNVCYQKCSDNFLLKVKESVQHYPLIWITLRTHIRCWVNQVEGIVSLLKEISNEFPNLAVIFDGTKSSQHAFNEIISFLPSKIKYYNALSCEIYETIVWTKSITFFIAPLGAGTVFTSITNKPGIIHTHEKWGRDKPFSTNRRENCVLSIPVNGEIVHNNNNDVFSFDYRLDWRLIYKKVKKMV